MESRFRTDLLRWLQSAPSLAGTINVFEEENPLEANPPALSIAASASADWSSKSTRGREVRIALELIDRQDQAEAIAGHVAAIEQRIATLSPAQSGYRIVVAQFLRSRAERRRNSLRAILLEYRFRLLDTSSE